MNKLAIFTGVAGVAAGCVLGALPNATAEPEVRTVTKEVKVPGPVREVTKRVEVPVTPQACFDMTDEASEMLGISSRFAQQASRYPDLILQAAEAGMAMDPAGLDEVTAEIKDITAKVSNLNDQVEASQLAETAEACTNS
jgi:hypothetical protein